MLCQDEPKVSRNCNYIKAVLIFQDMLYQDMFCPYFESNICLINSLKFPWLVELLYHARLMPLIHQSSFNMSFLSWLNYHSMMGCCH